MKVHAGDVDPEPPRAVDDRERGLHRESELRFVVRCLDRLVRDCLDPRREPHERALHAGRGGARRLIGSVEDDGRACLGSSA